VAEHAAGEQAEQQINTVELREHEGRSEERRKGVDKSNSRAEHMSRRVDKSAGE
jgi:hypothetical protein